MEFFELTAILVFLLVAIWVGYLIGVFVSKIKHKGKIPEIRETAIRQSRAVLSGQFSEQIAPYMPDFPYKPTEARFIGKPIDFIVFKGMDDKKIDEIVFVEVKSGQNRLNEVQKSMKSAVENKNIKWAEYKIPINLTKKIL